MGMLRTIIFDEGFLTLADVLLSALGMLIALWLVVGWTPSVSRE